MTESSLAEVAVASPIRSTFTYEIPEGSEQLQPGQRLLVPFGRTRRLGFYLGPAKPRPDLALKPINRVLDPQSYINAELFQFCLWMARYYFANPADCLAAALPPSLKSRRAVTYMWTSDQNAVLPDSLAGTAKWGRAVPAVSVREMALQRGLLAKLVADGIVIENWPLGEEAIKGRRSGYRISDVQTFTKSFAETRFQPEPFDGTMTRSQLLAGEWSDYQLRKAVQSGVLVRAHTTHHSILPFIAGRKDVGDLELTEEQQEVLGGLSETLGNGFQTSLLHGVTGSGKTIVYCHLCREVLEAGKTVLVLTPEIALTGTTLAYFRGFFGDQVTVNHSAMTQRERLDSWRGIRSGRYRIVVGPRSALFAPLDDPGLIIVDEEHDPSYKQDDPSPRFQARDAAVMRAKMADIPIVLGSASPSLESYHHARKGQYNLLNLRHRPAGASLPTVRVVDMRSDRLRGDLPFFSYALKKEVQKRLDEDQQVILFLNRRGHSPQLKCADCGNVPSCPKCELHLVYHRVGRKLTCHYCGYVEPVPSHCPRCQKDDLIYLGVGTQKVEESLTRLFPDVKAVRLDSDVASGRRRAHQILTEFGDRKYQLLLGTQMVAKGLDFPGVTLVGVLAADLSMDLPDFRASERSFARLLQVAGRSGRAQHPGEVLIQTFYPDSDLIDEAARQDYVSFYEREIESRRALQYPPFSHLVRVSLSDENEEAVRKQSALFRDRLSVVNRDHSLASEILGPAPCPLNILRGRHRRHIIIKTGHVVKLVRSLDDWERSEPRFGLPASTRIVIDVDADDMM